MVNSGQGVDKKGHIRFSLYLFSEIRLLPPAEDEWIDKVTDISGRDAVSVASGLALP